MNPHTGTDERSLSALARWLSVLREDRPVLYATAGNFVSLVMGPITVVLVSLRLSPVVQGFYYTFGSLSILQLLAEFGLGQAIMQFASHQWPLLRMDSSGKLDGASSALEHVSQLSSLAFRWCASLAGALVAVLLVAGHLLFSQAGAEVSWKFPWAMMVACMAANFCLAPVWALLQGCHQLEAFWFYRLVQQIVNAVALWIGLTLGAGLWTPAIAGLAGLAWSLCFLQRRFPQFIPSLRGRTGEQRVSWRRDLWPVQWRAGIAWMSAYFTGQAFVPVLFHFCGPTVAGRMGMTGTLCNVLLGVATNFVNTKTPVFGALAAQRRFSDLDWAFRRVLSRTTLTATFGSAVAITGLLLLKAGNFPLADRLLDPASFGLYLGFTSVSAVVIALGAYLRSFRQEPFAGLYAASSLLIILAAAVAAPRTGPLGVTGGALAVVALFQLPIAYCAFRAKRAAVADVASPDSVMPSEG